MFKCLLSVLLFVSTCVVVSHNALAYYVNAAHSVLDEKGASEENPAGTDGKEDEKEKLLLLFTFVPFLSHDIRQTSLQNLTKCSKGFFNNLYNPPENLVRRLV
jgi:hypothetical protein